MVRNPRSNYLKKEGFSLSMYTNDELQQIHLATLEVLWREGVHIGTKDALDTFKDGGAIVDYDTHVVRIHPYMVEDAIRSAPSTLILAGRNEKNDTLLDGSRANFTTFGCGVGIYDMDTGEFRDTNLDDICGTARVADALNNVDTYCHTVSAGPSQPKSSVDLRETKAFMTNTSKHCMHIDLTCGRNAQYYIDMGAAVMGGHDKLRDRPIISALTCPQSPLALHTECCDIIQTFARNFIPCNILSMAMSGGTTPITLAGTLVVHNAEVLTGIVLSQLTMRGAPIMYGSSTTTLDMQYATAPVGSPELAMCSASVAALAQFYLLPSFVAGT